MPGGTDWSRWEELEPLLDVALATPPEGHAALIARVSERDPALAADLEGFLRDAARASPLPMLDRSAGALFASLLRDDTERLAPEFATALADRYRITRRIGAGGMATVYLAHDVRHDREVAIKILHRDLIVAVGRDRFLAEIRTTARLQHPHILPLLDSGEVAGQCFYVMPYVVGESLRDRLRRDRLLPIEEAIRFTREVAAALDYAHRQGVIHRDIKPENILLHDGQAMVADFGIALAMRTADARVTQTGAAVGTPRYMSLEQAIGERPVDARADIFSLGAVMFEMLTGDPPFTGNTTAAIVARLMTETPPGVRTVRALTPVHVEGAIAKALERLAADRWATVREFSDALADERFTHTVRPAAGGRLRFQRATLFAAAAVCLAGVAIGIAAHLWLAPEEVGTNSRFVVTLPDSTGLMGLVSGGRLALTRAGRQIAYVGVVPGGGQMIYLRSLADPAPRPMIGTEGGTAPFFSPDERSLAFLKERALFRMPIEGGVPIRIADSVSVGIWGEGNQILIGRRGSIYRVSGDGGQVTLVLSPDTLRRQTMVAATAILPGGTHALVNIGSRDGTHLGVIRIADGRLTELGIAGASARFDPHGYILFGRIEGTLAAAPFSLRQMRTTGPALTIARNVDVMVETGRTDFSVSDDGTIVYATGVAGTRLLVNVDRSGAARTLSAVPRLYGWPRISPDGQKVALQITEPRQPRGDVWVYDLPARTLSRLTLNHEGSSPTSWTKDGRSVVFVGPDTTRPEYVNQVRTKPWDGSGPSELVMRRETALLTVSMSPSGTWMVMQAAGDARTRTDLWFVSLDSTPAFIRPLIATPALENEPRLSADGRLLAYVSDESGVPEVYIRPMSGSGGRVQVSSGGGREPVWAPGGREMFYRTPRHLMSARLTLGTLPAVTRRDTLFEDRYVRGNIDYDVYPDGRQFLMIRSVEAIAELAVILNWRALLKQP